MSTPVAAKPDQDDVDTESLPAHERPPLEACGFVTVFDGQRATHQVNVADGLTATLRSGDVVFSADVSKRGCSMDMSDADSVRMDGDPLIVRVGELVAVFDEDVLKLSPPVVYAPGVVLRRCDARSLDASLYKYRPKVILLNANPGEGRRTVARGMHARLGLEGPFVELDGEEFHDPELGQGPYFYGRKVDDALTLARDGILYLSNFDRMHGLYAWQALGLATDLPWIQHCDHSRVKLVGSTSRRFRDAYVQFLDFVQDDMDVHELPTLRETPALVPRIVEVTLNRLPFHASVTADFIEALMLRLGEDLVAADIARLTEVAAVRARVGDHARLTAVHLQRSLADIA